MCIRDSLYIALAGGYAAGMVICFAISTVTTAIPRTGGDYVFVGRILQDVYKRQPVGCSIKWLT